LAAGHNEGLALWDIPTGEPQTVVSIDSRIIKLDFLSAGNGIASLTEENELLLWRINNQEVFSNLTP
jgi:WD40 repeat protein